MTGRSKNRFWSGEWPNLNSISIALDGVDVLTPAETGILYRLVWHIASQSVHSFYSDPNPDPTIPDDDKIIARIATCTPSEWKGAKANVLAFFRLDDGVWRLKDYGQIRLSREFSRSSIPAVVRMAVLARDSERCVYCGSTEGPFHFDHLWPVSRGGTDDANNIVVACQACNLSKGDKTLREWRS